VARQHERVDRGGATGLIFWIERFAVHDGPGIRVAVFLKGCPLRCLWCHSPESQSPDPELLLKTDRCIVCGTCVPACTNEAITHAGDGYETRRDLCEACGDCADVCPGNARTIAGRTLTVPDLLDEIEKDRIFFDGTGGVTFSGGEPLMQAAFLGEAIAACQAAGIHTAVETSGFGPWAAMDIASRADLILFDLKLFDDARHRLATGVSNRIILDNFVRLAARHPAIRVRIPVIPGVNDDMKNLEALGRVVAGAGVTSLDLLPYHTAGIAKYARLGRPYLLPDVPSPAPDALNLAKRSLEGLGLAVHIGG
jgi:pyruvate formate lyase activating enzyme